ncbi:hypothetical protein TrVE_jg8403 [Triparma verrucosa]|uniref:Uncharacterized protein n=1 Tax=Triparma verrucosa TaxID=1606542 RepID=A0A9W6ZEC5_9STRA|nr:hypothetical protein TrVE_jg8403 [Triparma verrucosa]
MSNSPQALVLSENHRGASLFFPRLKILFTFLLTTFFSFWVLISLKAGTTSGPDSLKAKLNCCGGVHVALGFFMWFWPPLLLGGIMYQISDHYGWNGRGTESWQDSCRDIAEYFVGFCMCFIAKNVEPLHTIDVRKYPKRFALFIFNYDGWRGNEDQRKTISDRTL